MSRDDAIVLDILKSAQLVIEFVGSLDKEAFLRDRKTQSAVLHQLLLVGEAVKRLSENYRAAHPEIPWKRVCRDARRVDSSIRRHRPRRSLEDSQSRDTQIKLAAPIARSA